MAAVSLLVVAPELTQAANDKEQLAPMVEKLKALPQELGRARRILADSGYASEKNIEGCAQAGIEPLIALKRERHHQTWRQRFAAAPTPPPDSATALQKMRRVNLDENRATIRMRSLLVADLSRREASRA